MRVRTLAAAAAFLASTTAGAAPIVYSGTSGNLSAEATFEVVANQLIVTLTNTAANTPTGQDVSSEGLAAVFFVLPGGITLNPLSATITSGSLIQGSTCDLTGNPNDGDNAANCTAAQTDVGGEFAYALDATLPGTTNAGVSSSGFGIFGDGNFGGPDLDNPAAVNGSNFLLVSENETSFNPNTGFANDPLIQGTVTFVLGITGGTLDVSNLGVLFQYGTSLTEPSIVGGCTANCGGGPGGSVPEPSTLLLLGGALLAGGLARRKLA